MIERVAYLSMHTCPLLSPGSGYAGGMNVYIHELARTMAERGVEVLVFTRRTESPAEQVVQAAPGYRVVHIDAGPRTPVPIAAMTQWAGEFAQGILEWSDGEGLSYDVVHSHYWLSGWAGVIVKEALGAPLANSFHTLGRVKDLTRRPDEQPSSLMRLMTEEEVIARSDCVIAATPYEFDELLEHYGASPERLCTSPPGIDHYLFRPGDRREARRWLGLGDEPLLLYAGRIQPLKGVDVAVEALTRLDPTGAAPHLMIVGGPSGPDGGAELERLRRSVARAGLTGRVHFVPPQPHDQLARFYQAADLLVMPSRSESFGLVAAEAQACGLPVVAARVGGLPFVVEHDETGILIPNHDPDEWAAVISELLADEVRRKAMGDAGIQHAEGFSWPATADRLLELYAGITGHDA